MNLHKRDTIPSGEACECNDHLCPNHEGGDCQDEGCMVLYRIDMEDLTGVMFCDVCADDAMESGVFCTHESEDSE